MWRSRFLVALPLVVLLSLAVACASSAPPASPAPAKPAAAPTTAPAAQSGAAAPTKAAAAAPTAAAAAPAAPKELKQVTVALNNPIFNPGISFIWIGKQLGYFAQEGLDPSYVGSTGASDATNWIASGKAWTGVPDLSPTLESLAKGTDMGVIAPYIMNRKSLFDLVTMPDSPINSFQDLKGKKIGVQSLGNEDVPWIKAGLRAVGLDPDKDISLIAIGAGAQAATALKNGQVDAWTAADVQRALAEGLGFKFKMIPAPPQLNLIFGNAILFRKSSVANERQYVVGFLRAVAKSTLFFITNPRAALDVHFKMYPDTMPKGVSQEEGIRQSLLTVEARVDKVNPKGRPIEKWGAVSPQERQAYVNYLGLGDKVKDDSLWWTDSLIDDINNFDQQQIIDQAKNYKIGQ